MCCLHLQGWRLLKSSTHQTTSQNTLIVSYYVYIQNKWTQPFKSRCRGVESRRENVCRATCCHMLSTSQSTRNAWPVLHAILGAFSVAGLHIFYMQFTVTVFCFTWNVCLHFCCRVAATSPILSQQRSITCINSMEETSLISDLVKNCIICVEPKVHYHLH
jgi:hypothetical protein